MYLLIILSAILQTVLGIRSSAFEENKMIPSDYTCQGKNISPPLTISDIPDKTVSMAIIMEDPDAPGGGFDHWVIYNIPPIASIKEDYSGGVVANNGKGDAHYTGPCPPTGVHHYHFKVFALDVKLDPIPNADKAKVLEKMKGHVLASGELVATYAKDNEALNKVK